MANPLLKKNPFMSLWLSGFHKAAGTARGQAAAAAKRQGTDAVAKATADWLSLWGAAPRPAGQRRGRRKTR